MNEGLNKINESRLLAESAHIRERNRLNDERTKKGLSLCPEGTPTKLSPEQISRETIRRYNCGVEYHWEPRDAPNCNGSWVSHQSCTKAQGADLDYVEKVLACKL